MDQKPKLDLGYDDLVEQTRTLPMTWVPALFAELIERAVKVKCFRPGGLIEFVSKVEAKFK